MASRTTALLYRFHAYAAYANSAEYQRISNQQFLYQRGCTMTRYEQTLRMKRQMDYNWKHGKEQRRQRLLEENRYAKDTLEQSLSLSRSLREESMLELRQGELPGMKVGAAGSVDLDLSSSSVVHVPPQLQQTLRSAKSAEAFDAAKEAIRAHYAQTMSSRISSYAHSREAKIKRAADAGDIHSEHINSIHLSIYFLFIYLFIYSFIYFLFYVWTAVCTYITSRGSLRNCIISMWSLRRREKCADDADRGLDDVHGLDVAHDGRAVGR